MTRRILFVYLPFFPMERHIAARVNQTQTKKPWWDEQSHLDKPVHETAQGLTVLVQHGAKGTRISALGPDGYAQGLWPDMKLAAARAMMPDIQIITHDIQADRRAFSALAHWMLRYSPAVATYLDNGFALDIKGCDHLFGGEQLMANDIASRLKAFGFTARIAIADNLACGFALSHHVEPDIYIMPCQSDVSFLDGLPVEALRLTDDTITLLKRLGLRRIGDVRCIARTALERRFRHNKTGAAHKLHSAKAAQSVQWRLDQLSAIVDEPLNYIKEPHEFRASLQCPDLALQPEAVAIALDKLLLTLCAQLEEAGVGTRRFCLSGYRADGGVSHVSVVLSQPANKPDAIKRLFKDRFDQIDCGFGIDLFVLDADRVEAMSAAQHVMLGSSVRTDLSTPSLAAFADVVSNRAGPFSVFQLHPCTSHVPERAQRFAPINIAVDWQAWKKTQPVWSPRPLRLLPRPETAQVTAALPHSPPVQFIWRKRLRKIIRSCGPERILPEWWHDNLKTKRSAIFRDYYDVEDSDGIRYWIFRAIKDEPIEGSDDMSRRIDWFVHGLF